MPPAVEAWSLNHWTTREVPASVFYVTPSRSPVPGVYYREGPGCLEVNVSEEVFSRPLLVERCTHLKVLLKFKENARTFLM